MDKDKLVERCAHPSVRLFTREGGEHVGVDLFARCPDCGFEGIDFPHIECWPNEITPAKRASVLATFRADAAALRSHDSTEMSDIFWS